MKNIRINGTLHLNKLIDKAIYLSYINQPENLKQKSIFQFLIENAYQNILNTHGTKWLNKINTIDPLSIDKKDNKKTNEILPFEKTQSTRKISNFIDPL